MLALGGALLGVAVTAVLAAVAVRMGALTPIAGVVAALFGIVIVVLAGFPYLLLLALFVLASSLATRIGFAEKERLHAQEGRHGERGISNVLAHILLPTVLVIVASAAPSTLPGSELALLYTCALAFGAADTFASEFGVLAGGARSILTGRTVPPGTNGGVSSVGQSFALVGALTTSLVAWGLFLAFASPMPDAAVLVLGALVAGFAACQIDSLLGETLENPGYLTKGSTNFLGMLSAILIGIGIFALAGGLA